MLQWKTSFPLVLQENTKVKIESVLRELCGDDCKLDIFQEDNSDEIIVSGKHVEGQYLFFVVIIKIKKNKLLNIISFEILYDEDKMRII